MIQLYVMVGNLFTCVLEVWAHKTSLTCKMIIIIIAVVILLYVHIFCFLQYKITCLVRGLDSFEVLRGTIWYLTQCI